MSRLVTKLLLSMTAFPLALLAGVACSIILEQLGCGRYYGYSRFIELIIVFMSVLTIPALTVIVCWTAIWKKDIRWNAFRVLATVAVALGAIAVPLPAAWASSWVGMRRGGATVLFLYVTTISLQLTLIWRQSRREEAVRVRQWRAAPTPHCPHCMGRLGGRVGGRCPHCAGDLTGQASMENAT